MTTDAQTQTLRLHANDDVDFHRLSIGDTVTVRAGMLDPTDMDATVRHLQRHAALESGEYQLIMEVQAEDGTRQEIKRWIKPDEQ
jgi:hypothetical protein